MFIHFIRHATMIIHYNQYRILVDPMLSPRGTMEAVVNSPNQAANPLVDLPVPINNLVDVNAVLVTHTHRDHFDDTAAKLIPKEIPLFCQPEDEEKLIELGFKYVQPIISHIIWHGVKIARTKGCHGTGELAKKMGAVSGFVFSSPSEPTIYITGDTIWCPEVETALEKYQPEITIVYAGSAQFLEGDPITMSFSDIEKVCRKRKNMQVVAVHMESFNHCLLTRKALQKELERLGFDQQVIVPLDGEKLLFNIPNI